VISISPVRDDKDDLSSFAVLFQEMEQFYGSTDVPDIESLVEEIRAALFGDIPSGRALIAFKDDHPTGFATYSFHWPAVGTTRSLFLKELFVSESQRGRGIGGQIMERLIRIARESGCSRIEWMTDEDNPISQRFYASRGYLVDKTKLTYRVTLTD
jgi:GNAT superfamily N-acetyltransferase